MNFFDNSRGTSIRLSAALFIITRALMTPGWKLLSTERVPTQWASCTSLS